MTKLLPVLALVTAVFAGEALAASVSESGKVIGASKSSVTAKVRISGGKPVKIGAFVFKAVPANCDGGKLPAYLKYSKFATVAADRSFDIKLVITAGPGGSLEIKGHVAADGQSASGTVSSDTSSPPPAGECKVNAKHWKVRAGY